MNDIIIPAKYRRGLDNAEYQVNAAHALLENIIEPMIHCTRCEGLLIEYAEQTGGDLNKAARAWMEENIDVLYAAEYAAQQLLSEAILRRDIEHLQDALRAVSAAQIRITQHYEDIEDNAKVRADLIALSADLDGGRQAPIHRRYFAVYF